MTDKPTDEDVKASIAHILSEALLRIRLIGATGDAKSCEIEADHVHNLPNLLLNFSDELLAFYYNIERKLYITQSQGKHNKGYEEDWKTIANRLGIASETR